MSKLNFIKLFISLFYYLSCIKINNTKYYINSLNGTIHLEESSHIKVNYDKSLIIQYEYINIKIVNNKKTNFGQIAFFSTFDYDCMPNRDQMSINPYGNNFIPIKISFLLYNSNSGNNRKKRDDKGDKYDRFYLCIYCLEESCNYNINIELDNSINITKDNNYFNYYTNNFNFNSEMSFSIETNKNNKTINDDKLKTYELYWFKRMNNDKYINFTNTLPEYYNGILLADVRNESNYLNFTINSESTDYIKVGRSIIIGNTNYEPLKINDIETIGYLKKGVLEEQCFIIENVKDKKNVYIKATFYNKIIEYSYKDLDDNIIIQKGLLDFNIVEKIEDNCKQGAKFCVSLPDESKVDYHSYDNITFIVQLFSNELKKYNYYYNTLDIPGSIYFHCLSYDEIMILSGIIIDKNKKISITVNPIYGYPKVYLDDCKRFPFCKYEDTFDISNLEEVSINKMRNYDYIYKTKDNSNIVDSFQPLIIIHCPYENDCQFSITYFTENDFIFLKEEGLLKQYLSKDEKNKFMIDYNNHNNIEFIIIDVVIFSGNIHIDIKNSVEKITLLNKIVYIVNANFDEPLKTKKQLEVILTGINNSFYTIKYKLTRKSVDNNNLKMLYNRVNNIEFIDEDKSINIDGIGPQNSSNIIAFYSANCKFRINKNDRNIETNLFNNFYQDFFNGIDIGSYNISFYNYNPLKHMNNKCLLFANKIMAIDELNEMTESLENILIIENIPQIFRFENSFKSIIFKFPNYDNDKETIISIEIINYGIYFLYVYENEKTKHYQDFISASQMLYLEKNDYKELHIEFELCDDEIYNKSNNLLQVSVRQVKNKFFYLEIGKFKKDLIIRNKNLFLYFDIEEKDEGYIMVDFLKLKGEIIGKIIEKKHNEININDEVNWEKIDGKIIKNYDFYTKKLLFNKEDTLDCIDGCYLLISIKIKDIDKLTTEINTIPIIIMATLTNKDILNAIPIKFEFNDYIIGHLFNNNFELYEMYIPYDGESIDIEFHSDKVKLLVYIENNNNEINYDKPNFIIKPGENLFNIPKDNIKNITNTTKIENINFIFYACIDNDYLNTPINNITIYSYFTIKVHINQEDDFKIYKIGSEQKVLCQPQIINGKYICLFLIELRNFISDNFTILYAKSQNSILNIYGDKYFSKEYLYIDDFIHNFPTEENSHFNNKVNDKLFDFIVLQDIDDFFKEYNYLYVSIFSSSLNTIEFYVTSFNYYNGLIPNPNIKQFLALGNNNLENKIELNFLTQNALVINIEALNGKGELYFNNKLYNFEEKNNKISLILNSDVNENIEFKLKNENTTSINDEYTIPELVFYVEYYYRNPTINLNKINLENITEISYKNPTFPLYLYYEIEQIEDINIFFHFNKISLKNETYISKLKRNKNMNISIFIIEKKNILDHINNKHNYLAKFEVTIDPSICIGYIYIPKVKINEYKINNDSTIFLSIENKEEDKNIIYEEINIKNYIIKEQSIIPIFENVYYYGKINHIKQTYKYKLELDNPKEYTYIQFSRNSKMVNFNFSIFDKEKININISDYDYQYEEKDGNINVLINNTNNFSFIYLDISFGGNNQNQNLKLNNYVFKINTFNNTDKKYNYKIKENNKNIACTLTKSRNNNIMEITINKIENYTKYDIIYTLKIVYKNDLIKGEEFNTIALTESISNIVQIKNNKKDDNDDNYDNNDKVTFYLEDIKDNFEMNFAYIEVIAQIRDEYNYEYITYEPIKDKKEITINIKLEKTTVFIIICEIISFIIIISLLIYLNHLRKKMKLSNIKVDKKVKIKPLIKYDDIIIGKDEEED